MVYTFNSFAKDACTLDGITHNCKGFGEQDPELTSLPDGTYIPNFSALLSTKKEKKGSEQLQSALNKYSTTQSDVLETELNFQDALKDIPEATLGRYAKQYMSDHLSDLVSLIKGSSTQPFFEFPDPLSQSELPLKLKPFSGSALKLKLESTFGDHMEQIKTAIKKWPSLGQTKEVLNETEKKLKTVTPERKAHVLGLIDGFKKTMINKITLGRELSKLSIAEKSNIDKIQTIEVTDPDKLIGEPICQGKVPNAFYSPTNHSINICPNFFNLSDATIASVVGHEMGHSVDPCNSQFPSYKVDRKKLESLVDPNNASKSTSPKINEDSGTYAMFLSLISDKAEISTYPFQLAYGDQALKTFQDLDVLTSGNNGTPFPNFVMKDVFDCEVKQNHFKNISDQELEASAKEITQSRQEEMGSAYDRKADEARIVKAFKAYPECVGAGADDHSQMGEVTADYFGSEVLGEFLKDQKLKTPEEKLAPLSFFESISCMDRQKVKEKTEKKQNIDVISDAINDSRRSLDPHPIDIDRLEKVFLQNSSIEKALDCDPKTTKGTSCKHTVPTDKIVEPKDDQKPKATKAVNL